MLSIFQVFWGAFTQPC